jgi:hypothetical protein
VLPHKRYWPPVFQRRLSVRKGPFNSVNHDLDILDSASLPPIDNAEAIVSSLAGSFVPYAAASVGPSYRFNF